MTAPEKGGMPGGIEISKSLVLINSLSSASTQILSFGVVIWMHQFLLSRVSAEEYAIYPVILSVMSFTPILSGVMTGGIGRHVAAAYATGDQRGVTGIVSSIAPLTTVMAASYILLGAVVATNIGSILTVPPSEIREAQIMLGLLVIVQAVQLLLSPFSVGLFVTQRFVIINLVFLAQETIRIALLLTLLLAVSADVVWIVVSMVTAELIGLVATAVLSRRAIPALSFRLSARDPGQTRSLLSFGGWTVLGTVAYRVSTYADAIILNEMATPTDVAAQHIGALPGRRIEALIVRAFEPLQPVLTAMHATEKHDMLQRIYLRGNRYHLWVFLLPGVPLLVFGTPLAELYVDDQYVAGGQVLSLLTLAFLFGNASGMLYRVVLATAEIRTFFLWSIITQLLNVAVTIYLVGILGMGAVGAALGTLLTSGGLHVLVFWPLGLKMVGVSWRQFATKVLLPGLFPAAAAAILLVLLGMVYPPTSWGVIGLLSLAGSTIYLLVLLLGALRPDDRRDLGRLLAGAQGLRNARKRR